jgi:hypothetical protein
MQWVGEIEQAPLEDVKPQTTVYNPTASIAIQIIPLIITLSHNRFPDDAHGGWRNHGAEEIETAIVALAVEQPAFGQVRIANEFRKRGLTASLPACFLEAFVIALILVVAIRFAVQIVAAAPPVAAMLSGFLPSSGSVQRRTAPSLSDSRCSSTPPSSSLRPQRSIRAPCRCEGDRASL